MQKGRYIHLNSEFQRIARRGKKSLPQRSMQRNRETVEWKRLEISSRKLDTKGTFHTKMGSIKDINGMEDSNKRWQEYTEELYKKGLHDPDKHNGVIAHLEPDILESDVKSRP